MKWLFTVNKDPHEAEWRKGAMRCTMPEVIGTVDEIIFDGRRVPCGSASHLVKPTLETEEGGYAVITLAIKQFADYGSLQTPLSYATVITDVFEDDEEIEKARSFGGDRSLAGRFAARIRWGQRRNTDETPSTTGKPEDVAAWAHSVKEMSRDEAEAMFERMYPEGTVEKVFTQEEIDRVYSSTHIEWFTHLRHPEEAGTTEDGRDTMEVWYKPWAAQMDSAFEHALPLPQDMVLHRGIRSRRLVGGVLPYLKIGESFTDKSFTSTTTDIDVAVGRFGRPQKTVLQIVVPKGTKVLPARQIVPKFTYWYEMSPTYIKHNEFLHEYEVMLPRNKRYTLIGKQEKDGVNYYKVVMGD